MKLLWIGLLLVVSCFVVEAAVPQLRDFNLTQFQTNGGIVGVKSGASLTNTTLIGSPTLNGVAIPYGAANYVVYGATNSTLPNSRVLSAGSNVTITESGTNLTVIAAAGGGTNGLPDPGGNGIVVRTATNTTVYQTIVGVANETVVTNGDGVLGAPTVALAPKARFLSFTNVAEMSAATVADGTPVILKGYYVEGDAPAVTYVFVAGDTSTVDNGSVVTNAAGRFKLQPQGGRVDIRTFGAIADYSGEVDAVWTNTTTGLTLAAPLSRDYTGKIVAVRRGNTSVDASLYPLVDVGGIVTNWVIVNPGQGYINVPTLTKSSGPGSGGTFTINLTAGQVSSVTIGAGGTLYTTNTSIFSVISTDLGKTTNAPYMSEQFTVSVQSGTAITLSGIPTFAMPLNPNDNLGKAIFYTDNATAIQNALNYATNIGAEVVIPAGDFCTGPTFANQGQKVVGLDRSRSRMIFSQGNPFLPFRTSVISANDINTVTGRQAYDSTLTDVHIENFTIDGNGQWQNPMGANLANGSFALMGINCLAGERWSIEHMTITNAQGDGLYLGSLNPTTGSGGDWSLVRSRDIVVNDVFISRNWRNGSQMGNVQDSRWTKFRFKDNSVGMLEVVQRRGNAKGTYSQEEIDFEANSGAVSGYNHFTDGELSSEYGRGVDQLYDQRISVFDNVTFKNFREMGFSQSPGPISTTALDQEGLGEWTRLRNCRFIITSTNYGQHAIFRHRGTTVENCYFEGAGGTAPAVQIDPTAVNMPPNYRMGAISFRGNQFNLFANAGGQLGIIQEVSTSREIHRFNWSDDNVIWAGRTDMRDLTSNHEKTVSKMAGLFQQDGYVQDATVVSPMKSELSSAGLGTQDFTVHFRANISGTAAQNNGEWFRFGSSTINELRIWNRLNVTGKTIDIDWNPTNTGTRTITVPWGGNDSWSALQSQTFSRPINVTLTRKIGGVYGFAITDGGTNYTTVPTIGLTGFGGSGASAVALIGGGQITNIAVLAWGTGFTTNFAPTITGGGGSNAVITACVGKLDVYLDDELAYTETSSPDIATRFSTAPVMCQPLPSGSILGNKFYQYAVWNKALTEVQIRRFLLNGVDVADQWGVWGSTAGCLTYVKLNTGVGMFFPDQSANNMHLWSTVNTSHGIPKRSGQILKRVSVTAAAGATNGFSVVGASTNVIPANARITSAYIVPQSGAAPTVRIGFDSAITDQLVAPVTLTASTTNYLSLVPSMVYGTTNRPVYIGQTGAATNDIVINYSLDQGGLDGSAIQSGIVTAPGGLGSTSAIAATAIDATGWTNTFGVNAMVYAEGTGLQFTVYNAAGTPVYTNAATVGSASIALQKGAKMIVIAGTGVSGRAVPW